MDYCLSYYLEWDIRTTPFKYIASFIQLYQHYGDNYMSSDENNLGLYQ